MEARESGKTVVGSGAGLSLREGVIESQSFEALADLSFVRP